MNKLGFAVAIFCAGVAVSCSSGASSDNDHTNGIDPNDWETMQQSTDWQDAYAQFKDCMRLRGYPSVDESEGVPLKDGTIHKPEIGTGYPLTGAYLDFRVAGEECENASGLPAIRNKYNTSDPTPDPARQQLMNTNNVKEMACMEQKGWEIPEPVTSRGLLIFDVQFASDEERDAYMVDFYRCQAELGTRSFP